MKLLLLISLLYGVRSSEDYPDLTIADGIIVPEFSSQAAQNIRSIGRSYAYDLMDKQNFTDYIDKVYDIHEQNADIMKAGELYANEYTLHVVAVGAGILLFILLLIGFIFTPCCCVFGNRTQKQTSGMAMWRMVWGTILVILLGANIAGLVILAVSGADLIKMEDEGPGTIKKLGDDFVNYLGDTDEQIETLKTNQIETLFGKITPIFDAVIDDVVTSVKATPNLDAKITDIVDALNGLGTTLDTAESEVTTLSNAVNALTNTLTTVNDHLDTCKTAVEACDAASSNQCSNAGVTPDLFATSFDPDIMQGDSISGVSDEIAKLKSFPESGDTKTLSQWATFVDDKWTNIGDEIRNNADLASARTDFETAIDNGKTEILNTLENNIQVELRSLQTTIGDTTTSAEKEVSATIKYLKKVVMLQTPTADDERDVSQAVLDLTAEDIGKYAVFGLFVLVCVILGFLILTAIVGLLSTLFGCCLVSDDVLPTERRSGVCGNLLMCTSYCSVILCSIVCLVAGILITPVMMTEGPCKQYDDKQLLTGIEATANKLGANIDIGEEIRKALSLDASTEIKLQVLVNDCSNNETFFEALSIEKNTVLFGSFSFDDLETQVNEQIDNFDVNAIVVDDSALELISAATITEITTNKDAFNGAYDYGAIKTSIEGSESTGMTDDEISALQTNLQTLIDDGVTSLQTCKNGVDAIVTTLNAQVTSQKTDVVNALDAMSATTSTAMGHVDDLTTALTEGNTAMSNIGLQQVVIDAVTSNIASVGGDVTEFVDWLYGQFKTTIGNCQPLAGTYFTVMNFTCDGIIIHLTLLYCGMSLVGFSLLFYMCVSRCLARYFIKYNRLHPDDEGGNGWGPYPGHYAQTKL